MLLCRQVHSLDKESIWIATGSLVRFACSLGLHRDPRHFPSLRPFECVSEDEGYGRCWWN